MSLDYPQIIKKVFDSVNDSLKVTIENLELNMELSHTDGDSLYTHSKVVNGTATSGVSISCSEYKKIAVYSVSPVALILEASPDGTNWFQIDNSNATYILKDLCALNVRLTFSSGTVRYVLQS